MSRTHPPEGWVSGRLEAVREGEWSIHDTGPTLTAEEYEACVHAASIIEDDIEQEAINFVHTNGKEYLDYARRIGAEFDRHRIAGEWNPMKRISAELRYRALNWLLSFRAYLDHTQASLTRRYGKNSAEIARFKSAGATAYDDSFSYRFCYRLRNYAQHVGFPPLEVTIRAVEIEGQPETWAMLKLNRDKLLANYRGGWGTKVRTDLESSPSSLILEEHVVEANKQLNTIHETVLDIDGPFLQEQLAILRGFIAQAPEGVGGSPHLVKLELRRGRLTSVSMRPLPLVDDLNPA